MKISKHAQSAVIYIASAVILVLVTFTFAIGQANAAVFIYSIDQDKGMLAIETSTSMTSRATTRVWLKIPDPNVIENLPYFSTFSPVRGEGLYLSKEIRKLGPHKTIHDDPSRKEYFRLVFSDEQYTRLIVKENTHIKDRVLLYPPLPFIELAELFTTEKNFCKSRDCKYYAILGDRVYPLTIINQADGSSIVYYSPDQIKIAEIDPARAVDDMPLRLNLFSTDANGPSHTLLFRSKKANIWEVQKNTSIIRPRDLAGILEPKTYRTKNRLRRFVTQNDAIHYVTSHQERMDFSEEFTTWMREKLLANGVILSKQSYDYMNFDLNTTNGTISPQIRETAVLTFDRDAVEITNLKDKLKKSKIHVQFHDRIDWSLGRFRELNASLDYTYDETELLSARFDLHQLAARELMKEFGKKSDYFEYSIGPGGLIIRGYQKVRFFFDKRVGEISIPKDRFWAQLKKDVKKRSQRFAGTKSFSIDKNREQVVLDYLIYRKRNVKDTATIDLQKYYKDKFNLKPDFFELKVVRGNAHIKGQLRSNPKYQLTAKEVVDKLSDRFTRVNHIVDKEYSINLENEAFWLIRTCKQVIPISSSDLRPVIEKQYDIMDEFTFKLDQNENVECSFWGFQKQR